MFATVVLLTLCGVAVVWIARSRDTVPEPRPLNASAPTAGAPGGALHPLARKRGATTPQAATATAFERGVAAYNADDIETAADAFEEAVRIAPDEPEAHINLGLVYLRLQRSEDAMRELETGSALQRGEPSALPHKN